MEDGAGSLICKAYRLNCGIWLSKAEPQDGQYCLYVLHV